MRARIIFTAGRMMVGLNAKTGKLDPGFGKEGEVDMVVPYDSAPVVYKNMLLVGANTGEAPATGQPGTRAATMLVPVRRCGIFTPCPTRRARPRKLGRRWLEGSLRREQLGFLADCRYRARHRLHGFWRAQHELLGRRRHGNDLFGNSVVALDAETGKMKWYYQVVHHDIFDYDLPPAPLLMDVTVKGKKVPILAQTTKSGYMYILDRVTGKPVFGVEETAGAEERCSRGAAVSPRSRFR